MRAAAADGAELIVLPEKWTAIGSRRAAARRRRAARRAGASRGRARSRASSASSWSPARSSSASPGAREARQHLACTSAPTARSRRSTARCTCSTSRSADAPTASPTSRSRARRSSSRDGRRRRAGHVDLLRPALPRALSRSSPCAARACSPCPPRSRWRRRATTGSRSARPRDREPGFVIAANQIGAHPGPCARAGAR